jgi:glycosyltransferase involved in cell wall biosynthesis
MHNQFVQEGREPTMSTINPSIAVLLATYNGAQYLQEQLDSYAKQTLLPALILVSDDGSTDATRQILKQFAQARPHLNVQVLQGPCRGVAQNFLYLMHQVPDHIDMVSFSDQDDIWLPGKLTRSVQMLAGKNHAALYCARTLEWQAETDMRRLSQHRTGHATGFRHALVQNIAGGNTMVLNKAALEIVRGASLEAGEIVMHDWWVYQIIAAAGGQTVYDDIPMMLYRQHQQNVIGANRGVRAKFRRLLFLFSGRYRQWGTVNIRALQASKHRITAENANLLAAFASGRDGSVLTRLAMIGQPGFYRHGVAGQASLYLAAFLRRM